MHKFSASFIAGLGAAAARKHAADEVQLSSGDTPGAGGSPEPSGIADRIQNATAIVPGSFGLSGHALGYPAVAGGFMGAGAGAGGAAGGVAGALHGLLSPGEDEEGEERSRLMEALKRALQYGAVGTVAGAAAGPALLPGGLIGGLGAHALTGGDGSDQLTEGIEEANNALNKDAADLGRAAARQMHKQAVSPVARLAQDPRGKGGWAYKDTPQQRPVSQTNSNPWAIYGGSAAKAVDDGPPSNMTNPTPTGDLPNYYDQEMYELNRPGNQADSPDYRSGSALKPEIQAGFPPQWFRGPVKNTPSAGAD